MSSSKNQQDLNAYLDREYLRSRHAPGMLRKKQRRVVEALLAARPDTGFPDLMMPQPLSGVDEASMQFGDRLRPPQPEDLLESL